MVDNTPQKICCQLLRQCGTTMESSLLARPLAKKKELTMVLFLTMSLLEKTLRCNTNRFC